MPRQNNVQTKIIDSDSGDRHEYTCVPFGASESIDLAPTIMMAAGDIFGKIAGDSPLEGIEDSEVTTEDLAAGLSALAEHLQKAGGSQFLKQLLKFTTRKNEDGKEESCVTRFDEIYQANFGELMQAIWFVLDVNFGPTLRARFISGVTSLQGALKTASAG